MRRGRQCMSPEYLWHGHAVMRCGYLFKTCYISTALHSPWHAVGATVGGDPEGGCKQNSLASQLTVLHAMRNVILYSKEATT